MRMKIDKYSNYATNVLLVSDADIGLVADDDGEPTLAVFTPHMVRIGIAVAKRYKGKGRISETDIQTYQKLSSRIDELELDTSEQHTEIQRLNELADNKKQVHKLAFKKLSDIMEAKDNALNDRTERISELDAEITRLSDIAEAEIGKLSDIIEIKDKALDDNTTHIGKLNDEIHSVEELLKHIDNFIDTLPDGAYSLAEFGKTLWSKFEQWSPLNAINFIHYRRMMFTQPLLKRRRISDNSISFFVQPDIKEML